jgi:hypothetical protein
MQSNGIAGEQDPADAIRLVRAGRNSRLRVGNGTYGGLVLRPVFSKL